jgi:hypothetical protein
VIGRIVQRPEAGNWVLEFVRPAQCSQPPSLLISISKPSGMRGAPPSSGTLQSEQGIPGAPQPQAFGPLHGLPGWVSQTQPMSWHRLHFIQGNGSFCDIATHAGEADLQARSIFPYLL